MKLGVEFSRAYALALLVVAVPVTSASAQSITSVFQFYGSTTEGDVIFGDAGYLFGTTNTYQASEGGTIYRVNPDGTGLATLYQLGTSDGVSPNSGLLKASDGNYYGTTQYSTRNPARTPIGYGSIYQFKTRSGVPTYTTLHAFNPSIYEGSFYSGVSGYIRGSNLMEGSDAALYGVTPYGGIHGTGTVYRLSLSVPTATPTFFSMNATNNDGKNDGGVFPSGSLIEASDNYFYGTSSSGGANGAGAVFRFDSQGGQVTSVLDFSPLDSTSHSDCGTTPSGGVIEVNGVLYGTTSAGGASGYGTVFRLPLSAIPEGGSAVTCADITFDSFDGVTGAGPVAELIKDTRDTNTLWGTSVGASGTSAANGTLFSVDISDDTPALALREAFDSTHGSQPRTRLLQSVDGNTFYGTTTSGGGDYCTAGTVFRYGASGTDAGSPCPKRGGGSMTPALLLLLSSLGLARRLDSRRSGELFG